MGPLLITVCAPCGGLGFGGEGSPAWGDQELSLHVYPLWGQRGLWEL